MKSLEYHRALIRELAEGHTVSFLLKYSGPLPSANRKPRNGEPQFSKNHIKQCIRRQLHPQLKTICERDRELRVIAQQIQGRDFERRSGILGCPDWRGLGKRFRRGPFQFVPLVIDAVHGTCQLSIQFLRHEAPGSLIVNTEDNGGDIDNRLKTFFDALQILQGNQLPANEYPRAEEVPFYCLMEDDALITKFSVESKALHTPASPSSEQEVELLIDVTLQFREKTYFNQRISA